MKELQDFHAAGKQVLEFLNRRFDFDLWMITRVADEDWIVLQSEDAGQLGVNPGHVFRWADSFCTHMVEGEGPRVAPNSDEVPVYRDAPIAAKVPIKSYIGVPLTLADGSLFGTLCAIDKDPKPESIREDLDLVELQASLLSTILQAELKAAAEARAMEHLAAEVMTDTLTAVYNRRGWDQLLAAEEDRCRRHGSPAAVVVVDLDEMKKMNDSYGHAAGDDYLRRAAMAMKSVTRGSDVVARLGGDEFGLLSVECNRACAEQLVARLREAFTANDVKASVGYTMRNTVAGLETAWHAADAAMYEEKQSRRDAGIIASR